MGPHDGRYKLFFSYRRMMEDLVRGFLREGWLHGLDLETLEPVPTNFVSRRFRQKHGDCLWRAGFEGADGATTDFYFLVEFQSKPDRYMPLRLLCYEGLLLEQLVHRRRLAAGGALPPIVTLVIPRGTRRWSPPLELRELFAPVPADAVRLLPGLTYLLIDRERKEDKPDNIVAAFFRIEEARSPEDLLSLARPLARMLSADHEPELRQAFTELLVDTFQTTFPEVRISRVDDLEELHMLEQNMMRWRRRVLRETRAQGLQEGKAKGLKEGRKEGQVEGMRRLLLKQLEQRFGLLPSWIPSKIDEISSFAELEDLASRLLTAGSLSELGLGDQE